MKVVFDGELWLWDARRTDTWTFVSLPASESEEIRLGVMPANRMNRDEFYAVMGAHDDARLRKVLWTLYWRGTAQQRARIEDELRPPERPKVSAKKGPPDPDAVLEKVTTFVELAQAGAYMAGDRRVHHTERSKWRHTFRGLAADARGGPDRRGPDRQGHQSRLQPARHRDHTKQPSASSARTVA